MKIAKLAPILAGLLLAACHGRPAPTLVSGPIPTIEQPPDTGLVQGVDLPIDASDVLNELKDSSLAFVARYYRDPASRWPPLSAREAARLSSLGLKIVAVWEPYSPQPGYFSYSAGYADALAASRQAQAVGQPAGSAIYFAIDFDARTLAPIEQYFVGVAAGLAAAGRGQPEYRIGVYGSGAVCEAVRQAGLARYSWLSNSTAWAGSLAYDGWDIRQGGPAAGLLFNHDSDEAKDDYGGFRVADRGIVAPYAGAAPAAVTEAFAP